MDPNSKKPNKHRGKKRPRLSEPSSDLDDNHTDATESGWNPEHIEQVPSKEEPTVDTHGNPMYSLCKTPIEHAVARVEPVRDLDWIGLPKALIVPGKRVLLLAALAQRSGMEAPAGEQCTRCAAGSGMFKSCVVSRVLVEDGAGPDVNYIAKGACMSCHFKRGKSCSFRLERNVAEWYLDYFGPGIEFSRHLTSRRAAPRTEDLKDDASMEEQLLSRSFGRPKKGGTTYSAALYKSPLNRAVLPTGSSTIRAICEELDEVRIRVEHDIERLSIMADMDLEDEMMNDPNFGHGSDPGDDDDGDDDGDYDDEDDNNDGSEHGSTDPEPMSSAGDDDDSAAISSCDIGSAAGYSDSEGPEAVYSDNEGPVSGADVK